MGTSRFETIMDFARRNVDVAMRCQGCKRIRKMTVEELGTVFGLATKVATAERRLRCSQCDHKGARLTPIPRIEE